MCVTRHRLWLAAVAGFMLLNSAGPVWAADPEEAQYNVVVTLYNAGQWQAALKKIDDREAQTLSDEMRVKYLYARALALEAGKKTEDARKVYEALIQKNPNAAESGKARQSLIFLAYAEKDFRSVASNCLALKQDSLPAADKQKILLMHAEASLALQEPQKAMALYQQALVLGADRTVVAPKLFNIYQSLQMHKEIVELSGAPVPGVAADALSTVRTEALLALGRHVEAEAEARKVPASSAYFARVSFSLAQALIRQNKLKDAITPLTTAIHDLKDPVPPPSAHLALAECLLADNRPADAEQSVDEACKRAKALEEKERKAILEQAAVFRIRTASAQHDNRKLIQAVAEARASLPVDKLSEVLYTRLFALHQEKDFDGILQTQKDDLTVFQGKPQEWNAAWIYFSAYKQKGKLDEGCALLEAFIQRKPNTPEAGKARLELVNAALTREDFAQARDQLKQLFAIPNVAAQIGPEAFVEAHYNAAAVAVRLNDTASAITALSNMRNLKPGKTMLGKSMLLLGQVYAQTNDWTRAAQAWNEALAQGEGGGDPDLRDRLGRALLAAGKPAEAKAQFEALAKAAGSTNKLSRETREAWARALYGLADFAGAGAAYQELYGSAGGAPLHAYECAVCMERAEKWNEAEKWYLLAEKGSDKLSAEYAQALPQNLSRVRFKTGTGDRGFSYWIEKLAASAPDADCEAALPLLARIAGSPTPPPAAMDKLESLLKAYAPENARRYGVGAIALQLAAAGGDKERLKKLGTQLVAEYAGAEKKLPAKKWSTTVAPAMIYYFMGEAERLAGNQADALVAYETVLAAYPYNEWPDAAGCGAAECYAALGDTATAATKWNEVVKSAGTSPGSAKWRELAARKVEALAKEK
ncbi:MAG: tetratricopeptide repeat protein [Kiritimatiellia bacterium]